MKVISKKTVFASQRFNINEDIVAHGNGMQKTYLYVDKPNAVMVVLRYNNKVGMIKSERYLLGGCFFELLGGRIEANETSVEAAIREVKEECGLNLSDHNLAFLLSTYSLPGITNEKVDVYVADIGDINSRKLQEEELITEFVFFDRGEICKMLKNGEIPSCTDAYALAYFLLFSSNGGAL